MSSNNVAPIDPNVDPYGYLGIIRNPDGSITRTSTFRSSTVPPSTFDPDGNPIPVLSKDVHINQANNTWARLYISKHEFDSVPNKKLPVIVYYHGGGFVLCSPAMLMFQKFVAEVAKEIPAVIVAVGYRLAPEHRLPAAYDDCVEALHWVKTSSEEWITDYADLSNCFLMGSSAGGNIVYNVGLRVVTCVEDLAPLKIQGLILHQPFFGGVQRTPSELRLANDKIFPPSVADIMWDLALPIGVDRDHEYSNPTAVIKSNLLEEVKNQGWKVLVTGSDGDALIDRQIELVKMLQEKGIKVIGKFSEGGFHGIEIFDESKAIILNEVLKNFVFSL